MQCSATTRKNKPCPLYADRKRDDIMYCHVHDPEGEFRRQYPEKAQRKKNRSIAARVEYLEERIAELENALDYVTAKLDESHAGLSTIVD